MEIPKDIKKSTNKIKRISLKVTPILFILFISTVDLDRNHPEITYSAGIALLMAVWWITEAVPLAITSLIPLILFPCFGIMDGKNVSTQYINHIIFIFIGGFMVALAMERWNLHKRIALKILMLFGAKPKLILLGFMSATAFLSMWISNTASTMMMVPIALAIVYKLEEEVGVEKIGRFSIGIFLAIAYSASIGGISTLIGTPPNLSFVRILNIFFPQAPEISFAKWFLFAFPISVIFLIIVWIFISSIFSTQKNTFLSKRVFEEQYEALGPMTFEEKVVLIDFVLLVILWMFRADIQIGNFKLPGWSGLFKESKFINDGTISIAMAFLLFIIPTKNPKGNRIMNWDTATRLPWNIVLLFGGGFALASGFKESGLSFWLGKQLEGLSSLPIFLIIAAICLFITFLTELTSNTATAEILLPILAALAISLKLNPLLLMIPGTLSCSCAFMLPVATPPNAIVFGTNKLTVSQMAKAGFLINLIGILIITAAIFLIGKWVFAIDLLKMPSWILMK